MFGNKGKIRSLEEEIIVLKSEVLRLTTTLDLAQAENINLLQKLESMDQKKHNERGAGRKKTISKSVELQIQSLLQNGRKVSEIVAILNEQGGEKWTHSKVTYIKNEYLKM